MPRQMKTPVKHQNLVQYNSKFLGIYGALLDTVGEKNPTPVLPSITPHAHNAPTTTKEPLRVQSLPSAVDLIKTNVGNPDEDHPFTQEAYGETIIFFLLKLGYVNHDDLIPVHPLIPHLILVMRRLSTYDFIWIRSIDRDWASSPVE